MEPTLLVGTVTHTAESQARASQLDHTEQTFG
jgi:hypothetical protein